jgi:hypothetical protein
MSDAFDSRSTNPSPETANSTTPFRHSRRFVIGAALFAIVYAIALACIVMVAR